MLVPFAHPFDIWVFINKKLVLLIEYFAPRQRGAFFLFFRNAFIQLFTELRWFIEVLCCHVISPLKSPAIARLTYLVKIFYTYSSVNVLILKIDIYNNKPTRQCI